MDLRDQMEVPTSTAVASDGDVEPLLIGGGVLGRPLEGCSSRLDQLAHCRLVRPDGLSGCGPLLGRELLDRLVDLGRG